MKALKNRLLLIQIFILLIASFGVVFYKFNQIPFKLAFDEVELAKLALSLNGKGYIPYSTLADGHGTPYFYIMLLSFKLLGVTSFAMRLPVALFSILSPLIVFFILRFALHKKASSLIPFLATLLLITTRWYFNFARFAFEMPFLFFLEASAVILFFMFRTKFNKFKNVKSTVYLALSALFSGIAYNSYQPGRIFFIVPLFILIVQKKLKNILLFIGIFAVVISPMSIYLIIHSGNDIRFNQQFFLKNSELSPYKKTVFMTDNVVKTALMFNVKGDVSGRHNYPEKSALNPIAGLLFIAGLLIALKGIKSFYNQFFLLHFAIAIIPTILTYPWENPNMLRTYTSLIPIAYFFALSFKYLFDTIKKRSGFVITIGILVGIITISALYDLRTYYVFQTPVFENAFERERNLKINIEADQRNQSARPSL